MLLLMMMLLLLLLLSLLIMLLMMMLVLVLLLFLFLLFVIVCNFFCFVDVVDVVVVTEITKQGEPAVSCSPGKNGSCQMVSWCIQLSQVNTSVWDTILNQINI